MTPEAIIFDKDGTLFDFEATWTAALARLLAQLAPDDDGRAADALGFDPVAGRILPHSVAIAGTSRDTGQALAPVTGHSVDEIVQLMDAIAEATRMVPVVDLRLCLGELRRLCPLAVVTNDSEAPARRHVQEAGLADLISFLAGYDSGHGVKPAPDPLLAAAGALGADPGSVMMVGDSLHDLVAGRRAGMITVGVLTGLAGAEELDAHADVILPDIGHLEGWIRKEALA